MFKPSLRISTNSDSTTPQINFDQIAIIARHHHAVHHYLQPVDISKREDNESIQNMILQSIVQGQINHKLTRIFLQITRQLGRLVFFGIQTTRFL